MRTNKQPLPSPNPIIFCLIVIKNVFTGIDLPGLSCYGIQSAMSKQETHTHTHPFNGPLSGTTQVSRYQKGNTNLDFSEARDSECSGISWAICKSAPHSRQITMPAPHRSVFLQTRCPSCCPTNSVEALKARKCNKYSVVATDSMYLQEAVQSRSLSTFFLAGIPGLFYPKRTAHFKPRHKPQQSGSNSSQLSLSICENLAGHSGHGQGSRPPVHYVPVSCCTSDSAFADHL